MTALLPLEDCWNDVIRKARRGLRLSEEELSIASGLPSGDIMALEQGVLEPTQLAMLAGPLGFSKERLLALARQEYHPGPLELPQGSTGSLMRFTTPWNDFEVHSYLLWDQRSSKAAAFDTGSDASEMLDFLRDQKLSLEQIFLTHGHGDHVFELDRLIEKTGAKAWIGERENADGAENFPAGKEFSLGSLIIETRSTWGHAVGGISYVIHGLNHPAAIVGDALFAGSIGGPMISYKDCLETNLRELFSLPPETLLCPGHGPLTTVGLERAHNPFFP